MPSSTPEGGASAPETADIARRIREAVGTDSASAVAGKTGFGSHATRRYMRGEVLPPLQFLLALSHAYSASIEWLATGRGMRRQEDYTRAALATAAISELAHAIEDRLAAIGDLDPGSHCSSASCPMAEALDVRIRNRNAVRT